MTELRDNIYAIEVPEGRVFSFQIDCNNEDPEDLFCTAGMIAKDNGGHLFVELPYSSYEIMFTSKGVTEPQAEIVSPGKWSEYFENAPGPLFKDYSDNIYRFDNAIKSLQSLLKSKGLTAENYLIIKKVV